jgi:hypothetical protein
MYVYSTFLETKIKHMKEKELGMQRPKILLAF